MSEHNKALAAAIFHAVGNANWPAMQAGYARDCLYHGAHGLQLNGRDELVALAKTYKDACPDLAFVVNGQRATDDVVVTRLIAVGTNTGEVNGKSATDKRILVDLTSTMRIERGRVAEEWSTYDELATALDEA